MRKLAKRIEAEHGPGTALAPRVWPSLFGTGFMVDVERAFEEMWRPWWPTFLRIPEAGAEPAIDVFEEGDAVIVKAELPGLKKEEIDVEVTGRSSRSPARSRRRRRSTRRTIAATSGRLANSSGA